MSGGSSSLVTAVRPARAERGMVLVTALLMLLVVTILAVGMFRSFGLDEKVAGNMREKHRALNAAESAEQYAEYWLTSNVSTGVACAPPLKAAATPVVCSNPIVAAPASVASLPLPWSVGVLYTAATPTALNIEGQTVGPSWTEYYASPTFYIQYLAPALGGLGGSIFQIDAVGYGGSADTAAVIETTYLVQNTSSCSTCGP
jgi:type IV pilus assembly protein PilX